MILTHLTNAGFTWYEGVEFCGILGGVMVVVLIIIYLYLTFSKPKVPQANQVQPQQPPPMFCTNCGKSVPPNANFCPHCQQKV